MKGLLRVLLPFGPLLLLFACGKKSTLDVPPPEASARSSLKVSSEKPEPTEIEDQILKVVKSEVLEASKELSGAVLHEKLERLASRPEVQRIAEVVVRQTLKDGLYSSQGWTDYQSRAAVAVSALSSDSNDLTAALVAGLPDGFDGLVRHYRSQLAATAAKTGQAFDGILFLIFVVGPDRNLSLAVGAYDWAGEVHQPRQLAKSASVPKPPAPAPVRCDIGTDEVIQPGEGYLLTPQQVAASDRYWKSLDPSTEQIMRQTIATDTSPWFVCDRHIHWFNVDRAKARQTAADFWKEKAR